MITIVVTSKTGTPEVFRDLNIDCIIQKGTYFAIGEVEYNLESVKVIDFYHPNVSAEVWERLWKIKDNIYQLKLCQVNGFDHDYVAPKKHDFSRAIKEDV